jgi:alpha-amylase
MYLDRGIYDSPYDAFTNYMNILGDFISRVDSLYPDDIDNEELNSLLTTIHNQENELEELHKELDHAKEHPAEAAAEPKKAPAKKTSAKKTPAKKAAAKKA